MIFRAYGKRLAAFCALLPSAHHTQLLALSNLLLTPVPKKKYEGEEQPYDRKLLTTVCAQLRPRGSRRGTEISFQYGEAEQIVLNAISPNFGGNLRKFVEKAMRWASKTSGVPHSGRRCTTRLTN